MWPKMLFDLLPHFARLMPIADKYLSTRSASEKAQEAALAALTAGVRSELGKATDTQAGLLRQIQEQTVQMGTVALDVTRARMGVEVVEARMAKLEELIGSLEANSSAARKLLRVVLVLMALVVVLLVTVVVRSPH